MQHKGLHRIVATLIVAVSVGLIGCGGGASGEQAASTRGGLRSRGRFR